MFLSLAGWNRRAEPDQVPSAWDVQVRSRRAVGGVGRVVVRDGHVAFTPSGAQDVAWAVPVAGTKASRNYTPTRWPLLLRTPDDGRIFLRVAPVDHDLERSPWDRAPVQRHAKALPRRAGPSLTRALRRAAGDVWVGHGRPLGPHVRTIDRSCHAADRQGCHQPQQGGRRRGRRRRRAGPRAG